VHLGCRLQLLDHRRNDVALSSARQIRKLAFELLPVRLQALFEAVGLRASSHRSSEVAAGRGYWPSARRAR
jgi:hypothetical protein